MRLRYKIAIIQMIQSAFALSLMSACSKLVSPYLSVWEIVFYRSLIGFVCIAPGVLSRKKITGFSNHNYAIVWFRSLVGFLALGCFFYAIAKLELATAIVLNYTSPIFIAILSAIFLKEVIQWWHRLLTLLSFIGVYIVLQPYLRFELLPAIIGLLSGFLTACAYVSIRFLSRSIPHQTIVFYFTGLSTVLSLALIRTNWSHPPLFVWPIILAVGLLAYLGQLKLTSAFIKAPASLVSNFGYLNVIFSTIWGIILWQEMPTPRFALGATIIVASGILLRRKYR